MAERDPNLDYDNIRPTQAKTQACPGRSDKAAVHPGYVTRVCNTTEAGEESESNLYGKLPHHMKFPQNRGAPRQESEIKSIFIMTTNDNASANVPEVLRNLCGYLHGLETFRQRFENKDTASNINTDVYREIADDYADDASFIVLGFISDGYKQRLESVMVYKEQHSWYSIYEQFIWQCCNEEKIIAKIIQLLREDPQRDVTIFCRDNLKMHFRKMISRWKFLFATEKMIWKECGDLESFHNPCLKGYSIIEQLFGSEDEVKRIKVSSDVSVPERWIYTEHKTSKWIRQTLSEVQTSCIQMTATIQGTILNMDEIRKENFITLHTRCIGLGAIVHKLTGIQNKVVSENQTLGPECTEEETWFNESNYAYIDFYLKEDDRKGIRETAAHEWDKSDKETRVRESEKVFRQSGNKQKKYGELVKALRVERESKRHNIKTHVSELEERIDEIQSKLKQFEEKEKEYVEKIVQTQMEKADLGEQLRQSHATIEDGLLEKERSRWSEYLDSMRVEHQGEINLLRQQLATARKGMKDLQNDKENLLTRLSKIAGTKLVHGNPAITDLSDPNRPTKLSEKHSELYDNEWTDALEELVAEKSLKCADDIFVKTLLAILLEAFKFCCDTKSRYVDISTTALTSLPGSDFSCSKQKQNVTTDRPKLTDEQNQQLDEIRKTCVPVLFPDVQARFLAWMEEKFEKLFERAGGEIIGSNKSPNCIGKQTNTSGQQIAPSNDNQPKDFREDLAMGTESSSESGEQPPQSTEELATGRTDNGKKVEKPPNPTDNVVTGTENNELNNDQPYKFRENQEAKIENSRTSDNHFALNERMTSTRSDRQEVSSSQSETCRQLGMDPCNALPADANLQKDTNKMSESSGRITQVSFSSLDKTSKFAKSCVKQCWFMRIQAPPLHIDTELEVGTDINTDFYKNYTEKGKRVGFLVWPALFLHKGGPLLCKGIVQPLPEKK
ncbi:uncharacterized protein [Argopecten irradians]|uniref:uncharacterized protein isoform X2 n=1 Tax=Argopecten irradians TaxID=31199 RepID=UPI00371566EE